MLEMVTSNAFLERIDLLIDLEKDVICLQKAAMTSCSFAQGRLRLKCH